MKNRKLKTLAAALALTMTVGTVPPVTGTEIPMITTTVEAAAKKVSLKAYNKKVYVGRSGKIKVKSTRGAKLSYKTSNKKIATVNSRGVVTGKKAGTVKITITAKKSKYKTVKKTITVKVVKQNQSISARNMGLTTGQRKNLGAKARTPMTYKSSNPKVVTVDKKGNLKALRPGTAKIKVYAKATGTFNKASRTITVKVTKKTAAKPTTPKPVVKPTTTPKPVQPETKPAEKPEQTETPSQPETKPTEKPEQTETPSQPETKPTEKPEQTETPSQPETKPTEKPEQTETPSQPETKPTEKPEQTEAPDNTSYVVELGIEKTADDTIYIGEAKECNVKWKATGNTTRKDFIYTSSDPSVATIDENGNITGVKAGKVIITVTSKTPFAKGGSCLDTFKKYTVKAHYNDAYENGVGFKNPSNVDEKGRNVGIGETINPNRGITRYDAENAEKYLTFESSDPSVATIDAQGNITGVSKGYVTFTVKTKLPVDKAGQIYKEGSTTYHVGDYTYEEILNGLTMDTVAGQAAHEVMNDLRQNPDHRNFFKDYPSYPAREWADGLLRDAAARASRNIMCVMLGGWNEDEMSTINPLASHPGAFNGYGGDGWEATGKELGKAASVFFEDIGHFGNETDPENKYEAIAVVQYKNAAGINLTSMIVQASSNERFLLDGILKSSKMPENQFYDYCNHFNLDINDDKWLNPTEEEAPSVGENEDIIFTDGSIGAADITASAETADAGQQEETEETEEFEFSQEEETGAVSDIDVTFE
ncbi:Ig-like domain-containing protein [Ruminococcus sp. 2227st1_E6_2227SCRN_220401]|uniref:Ig-like domain-containing protein n=1 Tax=unclassified Ruminococcus TaxID=2608920 RepID=UPI00319EB622